MVDGWADLVADADADSPDGYRQWIDRAGVASLDITEVAARLGEAFVAANLAGRYDVDTSPVELAAASLEHARLPFSEQIEFFRAKLNIPTQAWTDIWQSEHDRAFVVAGASRDALLSDLRGAVDKAIAEGTTLREFRADFDAIVANHGWSYKGDRAWRTRVIYETNLRQSYSAGRFQQMTAIADRRPFWRYRHSHASTDPRQEHLAWDGLVLRHDDPWWQTHFPINGWGCKCYVESLNARDLERLGKDGPDQAPPLEMQTVTVGSQGPTPRTVQVPKGIDPGFAYTPGRSLMESRLAQTVPQPPGVASAGVRDALARPRALEALTREWNEWRAGDPQISGNLFVLGVLKPEVVTGLGQRGVELGSAAVSITRNRVSHAARAAKRRRGAALSEADVARLPEILAEPAAVLLDTTTGNTLLYVFESSVRAGKVVVRVNFEGSKGVANSVRTAGYVALHNLLEPRYELLSGELE